MKIFVLLQLFLLSYMLSNSVNSEAHDLQLAIFEIYQNEGKLMIDISFNKEDFSALISSRNVYIAKDEEFIMEVTGYLDNHLSVQINGKCANLTINKVMTDKLTYRFSGWLNTSFMAIEEVKIHNTCLLALLPEQDNIVKLKLNGLKRSFRMSNSRTTIVASYVE